MTAKTPTEPPKPCQQDAFARGLLKDRYQLEKELGRGAIGVVYLARDQQLHGQPVVIKILQEQSQSQPWFRKKFRQEIEALARLNHPGIVAIHDTGETPGGEMFLVMQFINGSDLRLSIPKAGMLLERAASIVKQVGQALNAAQKQGICHRDLKPTNILLERTGITDHKLRLPQGLR